MSFNPASQNIAIVIVAAGRGERSGFSKPKQYLPLMGTAVLTRAIEAFQSALPNAIIQTVIADGDILLFQEAVGNRPGLQDAVTGGANRQASVLQGLKALQPHNPDIVLIHDAARPLVSSDLIERVLSHVESGVGVVPGLPVADTLRKCNDSFLGETVSRDGLQAMQTPQAFPFAGILAAHLSAIENAYDNLTDDAEVFRKSGGKVLCVIGDRLNLKLTYPEDFKYAERIMGQEFETRTGQGFDVHAFTNGDEIILCGVRIPHSRSLKGHSDADVGLHALTDAVLGALADGDIGQHFPPSDPKWKGVSSDIFIKEALARLKARRGRLLHVDLTLICEQPKIGPHRQDLRTSIASLCGLEIDRVSVKATTSERLGFTGRGEGIAALATATISLPAAP